MEKQAGSKVRGKMEAQFGACDIPLRHLRNVRQLDIGTDVHGSSWMGHLNLGVISIKGVFEAMILDETIEGASVGRELLRRAYIRRSRR